MATTFRLVFYSLTQEKISIIEHLCMAKTISRSNPAFLGDYPVGFKQ